MWCFPERDKVFFSLLQIEVPWQLFPSSGICQVFHYYDNSAEWWCTPHCHVSGIVLCSHCKGVESYILIILSLTVDYFQVYQSAFLWILCRLSRSFVFHISFDPRLFSSGINNLFYTLWLCIVLCFFFENINLHFC